MNKGLDKINAGLKEIFVQSKMIFKKNDNKLIGYIKEKGIKLLENFTEEPIKKYLIFAELGLIAYRIYEVEDDNSSV